MRLNDFNALLENERNRKKVDVNEWEEHYKTDVQPIEVMEANMTPEEFRGFLRGNIIKYVCRLGRKDDVVQEINKIIRYANWLKASYEGRSIIKD